MAEQLIELVEKHGASLELSSDGYAYSTVEAEFSNIPETGVAIEAQIILFKEDTIVSASDPADCEITSESPTFWLSDTFFSGTGQVPDSYCVCFRVLKPEDPVSISAPVPPEISRQSGSFLIHEPKRGFLSKEKWNTGSITIESVIVKNAAGDDDEVFINLFSKKPLDSGFKVQAESSGSADETIFRLVDKPHLTSDYLRLHLQENLNVTVTGFTASGWSMSDKKPFLDIQNINAIEPEVEEDDEDLEVKSKPKISAKTEKTKSTKSKKNSDKTSNSDWEEVGKRAFNRYFKMFDKTENHDDSQEMAAGEIEGAMADAGIEVENFWYDDLPADAWVGVATGFINAYKYVPHEVGYSPQKDFMGAVHTWFSDCMHTANASHQDARLDTLIKRFNESDLNELLFEINDAWDQIYWELDEPIRENVISKYTKKYSTVGVRVGLVGKTLQENGEADPLETDFVISVNLICEDDDTFEPIDWKRLGVKEEMFEEVADATAMQFSEWAENGAEDGQLNFPAKIKSAFIDFDDETCSHYGTVVLWNDEKVY
jgi:ribosomal protein L12E/L44/L45/RPP1/RPP2